MAKNQIPAADAQGAQAADEKKVELSAAVAEKYNLDKSIKPGRYHFPGFGEVDLASISLAKADNLVKKGFPYLKPKNKKGGEPDADQETVGA